MELERTDAQDARDKISQSTWPIKGPADNLRLIRGMLSAIGENPEREGLKDTPTRVIKSWGQLYGGYKTDPADILKTTFTEGACHEMVLLKNIEFYSTCEHHLLPFFGRAHIAYIPKNKVVGISKLARLLEIYARRLQIQERMTAQIADDIVKYLDPSGCMVILQAQHMCMTARGIQKQNSIMVTSAIRGVFEKPEVRAEFMELIK